MATSSEHAEKPADTPSPKVVLIAYPEALLVSGEAIDLLPIRHENDVKGDVTKLLEDWAGSGFLLLGNIAYPWHQVQQVRVTRVEELTPEEAHQRLLDLQGSSRAQMLKGFWKTREQPKEESKKDEKDEDKK